MNKILPKVYANKIDKVINNSREIYYTSSRGNESFIDINKKINDLFKSKNFVYKKDVKITLKGQVIKKTIVGLKNNYLLTMDNKMININDIVDINEI